MPMPDGRKAERGGWNRIIINADDLQDAVAKLRNANLHFRGRAAATAREPNRADLMVIFPGPVARGVSWQ